MFFNVEWKKSDIRTLAVCFHLSLVTGKIKKKKNCKRKTPLGVTDPYQLRHTIYLPNRPTYKYIHIYIYMNIKYSIIIYIVLHFNM